MHNAAYAINWWIGQSMAGVLFWIIAKLGHKLGLWRITNLKRQ